VTDEGLLTNPIVIILNIVKFAVTISFSDRHTPFDQLLTHSIPQKLVYPMSAAVTQTDEALIQAVHDAYSAKAKSNTDNSCADPP
jgi:hypothetical protein